MTDLAVARDPYASNQTIVVWLDWPDYLAWLAGKLTTATTAFGELVQLAPPWKPGQHVAYIGPTGEGKTTHAVGVLGTRKYVLALDPKGEDETLSASGYVRVGSIWQDTMRWRLAHREDARTWNQIWDTIERGGDARVIVGGPADDDDQFAALRELMYDAVQFCRYAGGWTQYCDEFEIASSQQMFNLAKHINLGLISARRKGVSIVNSYQAQAWVSSHAIRQARMAVMWPTGAKQMIVNVAEGMGREWRDVAEAVQMLPPFHTLTIPRNRGPMVITKAPRIN
jgi:hypothetical protein